MKAADIEATRGHQGSSRLRVEALLTLRVLVAKVFDSFFSGNSIICVTNENDKLVFVCLTFPLQVFTDVLSYCPPLRRIMNFCTK